MPSSIPPVILLARERAASFRRCSKILHEAWLDPPSHHSLEEAFLLMEDVFWYRGWRFALETPLVTLEWVLAWANNVPPPPVPALREARTALEETASDWEESFVLLQEILKRQISSGGRRWPDWLYEVTRVVSSERLRLKVILDESWPVGGEDEEQKALAEMKGGKGIGLDDAFAQIAGVTKKEWARRVAEHKKKRQE
jgi:hypothetical protein